MAADHVFKQHDLGRPIVRRLYEILKDENPVVDPSTGAVSLEASYTLQPLNLTGATQVKLLLKDQASTGTGGGVATVTDAVNGEVTYVTVSADTNTVRTWNMEYEITWPTGSIQTVPEETPAGHDAPYYTVQITGDLG
jgi:hypothetical protein